MPRNMIPDGLVVVTAGAMKGKPGFIHEDHGGDTVVIEISSGTIQKRRNEFRPFTLEDMIVL